jgi:hypothetical protein
MAFLGQTFRASDTSNSSGKYQLVPPGWYEADIHKAELMTTKKGTGEYIKIRFDILGPSHQGRVVFSQINIRNENPRAESIGREQLGELIAALGLKDVSNTEQLVGRLQIKVTIKPADADFDARNEIKGFKPIEHNAPTKSYARKQWDDDSVPF